MLHFVVLNANPKLQSGSYALHGSKTYVLKCLHLSKTKKCNNLKMLAKFKKQTLTKMRSLYQVFRKFEDLFNA